jgi:hypothetical protein
MAIPQSEIRHVASISSFSTRSAINTANTLSEARAKKVEAGFLCHSHKDRDLAEKLQEYFHLKGWNVYIDWKDTSMPTTPNRETADKIQQRMRQCDWFLFLATANSMSSRWCPWELGYSDGLKGKDWIIVVPTADSAGIAYGNEYMQLYRRIDYTLGNSRSVNRIEAGNQYTGTPLSAL